MKTKIKVKLIGDTQPFKILENGDWIDLCARETVTLKGPQALMLKRQRVAGQPEGQGKREVVFDNALLNLGVAIELPKGFEAWVVSRSSGPDKFGIELRNSKGIIDNSYNGDEDEWKFGARAMKDTTIVAGTRIAQFRIALSQKATAWQKIKWLLSNGIEFVYVDNLGNKNRGGIGSTGIK